jgi:signal transduction histidine kinase/Flp pilus assembly protein TadD
MTIIKYILFLLSFTLVSESISQTTRADSLLSAAENLDDDSVKVTRYLELGLELLGSDINRAINYFDEAILIGNKINYKKGLANAYNAKGRATAQQGDFVESILNFQEALNYFHEINDKTGEANILSNLGSIYYMLGNSTKALELHFESLKISEEIDNKLRIGTSFNNIGTVYLENKSTMSEALSYYKKSLEVFQDISQETGMATAAMNIGEVYFKELKYDSAIYFHQLALGLCDGTIDATFPLTQLGEINAELGNFQKAFDFHRRGLLISERLDAKFELTQGLIGLAKTQKMQKDFEGAISTFERAKLLAIEIDAKNELVEVYLSLAETHALIGEYKEAYENEIGAKSVKEEIAKLSTERMIQRLRLEFDLDKKEAEIELLQKDTELKNAAVFNQRIIIFASLGGLFMFVVISISLFKNNLSKQKANRLLQVQKEEIHAQRENVESAYDQLKSTQNQLIQSEKMASLGELTAGIAHEIKNPLNFVNNFSDVCTELIDEMKVELVEGNQKAAIEIADDIKQNLQKISQHGKRADSIVQGMLEHSKRGSGQKQETDINALADEFLRMTYQSFLAKNKESKPELIPIAIGTNLDANLPKISVIPQDIGKVLLNLYSNAFYACAERSRSAVNDRAKSASIHPEGGEIYLPSVVVGTRYEGNKILISVKDNGSGIPAPIIDKIFQPFFTTKPTGQGTGLGLSLSYDVVKSHGGELKVETEENVGTEFTIILPI